MTPVVFDASAGVEMVAGTNRGRALRRLLPTDAIGWVPGHFYVECAAVLRRWDMHRVLPADRIAHALDELVEWPVHVVDVKGLLRDAWRLRANVTMGDAPYVALAQHLNAPLVTDDERLGRAPNLRIELLRLSEDPTAG